MPYLALVMTVAAGLALAGARWLSSSGLIEPGDDTPFDLMLCVPAALLIGSVLAWLSRARGWGSRSVANTALAVNAGLLSAIVAVAVVGLATFTGR